MVKMLTDGDQPSKFEILNYFYQILKRTILGLILCHGLVLDVGCGEGSFPKEENIVGIDVDRERLEKCRYISRVLGDACALPFKDKSFDRAIEMGCLTYTKEWRRALKEMLRVGKRVYLVEPIRRRERLHWFTLPELLGLGIPVLFMLRTFVVGIRDA